MLLQGAAEEWDVTVRRILLDSVRTTRDGPLFQGDARHKSVHRVERLLMSYALSHPKVGYCQGMADLAAPFVHLYNTDHEVGRAMVKQL